MSTKTVTPPKARLLPRATNTAPAAPVERLNVPLLAALIVAALVFAACWYGLNRWQVRRHAATLLAQADAAEQQERPDRAARFIGQYVGLVPSDTEARARYGMLLERLAVTPRARAGVMAVYEQVLVREPDRHEIRRRLVKLGLQSGQFDDAYEHALYLRRVLPEDAEASELQGFCHQGRGEYAQAAEMFRAAVSRDPSRIDAYVSLALLLRDRLSRPDEVKPLLARMVEAGKNSYKVYLARARYLQDGSPSAESLRLAQEDMAEALRLAPEDADVLLAAARLALKVPDGTDDARKYLARFAKGHPRDSRGDEMLAGLELQLGRPREAIVALRQALQKAPNHPDLLWNLANLEIAQGAIDEGMALLARLEESGVAKARLDFLRASARHARGDWTGATRGLEAARPLLADSRELTIQCDLLLARCYARLGDLEAQVLACRRVIALDPMQSSARNMLVVALQRLGRSAEALEECQRMLELPRPPAAGAALQARLMIVQNLRLPPRQRQWDKIDQVLDRAGKADPESVDVPILRAEVAVGRGDTARGREILERARSTWPKKSEFWAALADLAARERNPDLAIHLLDDASKTLGDDAVLLLARLRCLTRPGLADSEVSLKPVESRLERITVSDRVEVISALAGAYQQLHRPADARRWLDELAQLRPNDLDVRLRLFELAFVDGEGDVQQALSEIRRLEGEGGTFAPYNEARMLIRAAENGDRSGLAAARAKLAIVSRHRPAEGRVFLCIARIDDLEDKEDRAIENYLRAIEQGTQRLDVVRRVVQLLFMKRRYAEAELVIQKLPDQSPLFEGIQRLATEVSLQTGNYNRALELAAKAVSPDSKDFRDHMWLGQVLWAAAQRADVESGRRREAEARAEAALRRAVELAPAAPEALVALVHYLARTGQIEKANAALTASQGKLPAGQAALALAQCHLALSHLDEARKHFQAALQLQNDDLAALRAAADFYLRTNELKEAENCLRKVIDLGVKDPSAASWARAVLAVVLASSADYDRSREALALVGLLSEKRDSDPVSGPEQERARAVVLALQPGNRQHLEAISILERLDTRQPLSPEDQFLLIQLYERVGDLRKARDRMVPLIQTGGNARYLAHYIERLLQEGRSTEAEAWLPDLEKLQPKALVTQWFKARLMKAKGDRAGAVALLKGQAEGKDAKTVARVAVLIEDMGEGAAAEELYRRYAAEAKEPERVLVLARYYGRQGQVGKALDLCDGAWATCPPEAVATACVVTLHDGGTSGDGPLRVERAIRQALQKQPRNVALTVCLASLEELRGHYDEAESLYRTAINQDPRNAVALNNLAWFLALRHGKADEALLLVERAVEILGPIPELLDTRAVTALAAGRIEAAIADLREALGRPSLDPKTRVSLTFHLAQALVRAGEKVEAAKAWRDVTAGGLKPEALHALERDSYNKLAQDMQRS